MMEQPNENPDEKDVKNKTQMTEERVREIAREEITKWHKDNFVKLPKTAI